MVATYEINGLTVVDNEPELILLSPFGYTYKYNTIKGFYHFTFPGLLLGKYRTLFYDTIGNDDILICLVFSTVPYEEEEEENPDDMTEELINNIINDVIKEDEEELLKLDKELKHLSSNVLV